MMPTSSSIEEKKHHHLEISTEELQDAHMYKYTEVTAPTATKPKWSSFIHRTRSKFTSRHGWIGAYDYAAVCMPRIPFLQPKANESPFYGPNDEIPIIVALIMGLQHFLAVIGGLVAPTIMVSGSGGSNLNLDNATRQYLISASFIVSGLMSMVQILRFKIPKTRYFVGAGLLQITGVSFANVASSQALIKNMYASGVCQSITDSDGIVTQLPCPDAFGAVLGTQMIACLLIVGISFLPPRTIRHMFPKVVSGIVLLVIGASLLTSGLQNWGGGTGPCMARPANGNYALCPSIDAPNAQAWGSPINFALGASVFGTILLVEFVGSVFMKNISVVLGLLVGCIIAAGLGMFDSSAIQQANTFTFLWVKTFKISVYGPGIIPYLFTSLDMAIECLGDVTAASDLSGLALEGQKYEERCQGALLADGLSGVFSGLATSMGVVTFSQNNGIIAVTRCASRTAGFICAGLLIICGVFGKISAVFLALPSPLIGGMTTFLFASVATSGIRILGYLDWTRRDRIIVAASLSLALGVSMVPDWFKYVLPTSSNTAFQGFLSAIETVVSTGYIMAGILSVLLNLILPYDSPDQLDPSAHRELPVISGAQRFYSDDDNQLCSGGGTPSSSTFDRK